MLSLSTEYTGQSATKNIHQDWLLDLSYDDTTPGTFYFSGASREITNQYQGTVIDWGVITESIDLVNSKASISDVRIVLANSYANDSGLLSEELFGGSKNFINQDVVIRSWLPSLSLADSLTIYKGRLVSISHNLETVTLFIEKRSPWDRVKIANNVSTNNRVVFPAAYGDYTRNISTQASQDFCASKALWPMPVNDVIGQELMCLLTDKSSPQFENAHFFEPSLDIFVPIDPVNVAQVSYQSGTAIGVASTLKRGYDFRPTTISAEDDADFTDPENAIDGNTSTYAEFTYTGADSGKQYLYIDVPNIAGRVTGIEISVKYLIGMTASVGGSPNVFMYDLSYGDTGPEAEVIDTQTSVGTSTGAETIHTVAGYETIEWYNSDRYTASNTLPTQIKMGCALTNVGNSVTGYCRIYDVFMRVKTELDFSGEEEASYDKLSKIKEMYTGSDCYSQDWTGGAGTASYPHDIYRDMLDRYAGWDATGIDYVEVNGTDWSGSAIDTDRNWPCRWWTLEQVPLLETLRQVQFEGGFIWMFDETSSGREARIIYVKSSYPSVDYTLDGDDLGNISISMTPLSEIVTKRTLNFQRHPADDGRFLQSNSLTNSNRGDFNLDAEENAIEQDLIFLTDSDDVDDLLEYYDDIVGEPKAIVKVDLLNPADWGMQVGDSLQFANMPYNAYGLNFAAIGFMCVETSISPGKFTATMRKIL